MFGQDRKSGWANGKTGGKVERMETGIFWSEERGTWNLVVDGEWIFEGNYEQCEDMYFNCMED